MNTSTIGALEFYALDRSRWKDFEDLFGQRGACGGCWCMSWRLKKSVFESQKGEGNRRAMKELVEDGEVTGIIAYLENKPVAWCAVAPREQYPRLENSRVLSRLDDKPVWSITCLFIAKSFRRKGISSLLLKGVIEYCRKEGVKIIEAYPIIPYADSIPDAFAWTGILSSYKKAGFKEAGRRSKSRPIMRYYLE